MTREQAVLDWITRYENRRDARPASGGYAHRVREWGAWFLPDRWPQRCAVTR